MKTTYMDYSATTYVKPEVLDAMMPFFTEKFGNPSSFYGISRETKMAIDNARAQVAKAINCDPNEVYFTGGGSEADPEMDSGNFVQRFAESGASFPGWRLRIPVPPGINLSDGLKWLP